MKVLYSQLRACSVLHSSYYFVRNTSGQVQVDYAGHSRYVGLFDSLQDAAVSLEVANDFVSQLDDVDQDDPQNLLLIKKNLTEIRRSAFSAPDDYRRGVVSAYKMRAGRKHALPKNLKRHPKAQDVPASTTAAELSRGITVRPSGKWQVQMFYAGKSRNIGGELRCDTCWKFICA